MFADLLLGMLLPLLLVYWYELSIKRRHLAAHGYCCRGVRLTWPGLAMALPLAFVATWEASRLAVAAARGLGAGQQ